MSHNPVPCVCHHDPGEHNDVMGCLGTYRGDRPCLCMAYEADEVPF